MPGKRITEHQLLKYKDHRKTLSQTAAAAKAAISKRSARCPPPAVVVFE